MLLKALQDIKRSEDPQIVFEVALLRMSQAPQVADLKALLAGAGAAQVSRPKLREEAPAGFPQTSPPAPIPAPVKPKAVNINADQWLGFVEKIKTKDAFFAAKIENLLFSGCENLKITLQAPNSLSFLATQLQTPEMRQKLQGFIDSELAEGYTFEVLKSSAVPLGESAQSLAGKKLVQAEAQRMEKWQTDPRVQKAKEVFKGDIKIIKKEFQ